MRTAAAESTRCRCGRDRDRFGEDGRLLRNCSWCAKHRKTWDKPYARRVSARQRDVRPVSVNPERWSRKRVAQLKTDNAKLPVIQRPQTRGDCVGGQRPCPFVGCRHNLYLDVSSRGTIKYNFPDLEPEDMRADRSCALDVADEGALTLHEVGAALNMTRNRVLQMQKELLQRFEGLEGDK